MDFIYCLADFCCSAISFWIIQPCSCHRGSRAVARVGDLAARRALLAGISSPLHATTMSELAEKKFLMSPMKLFATWSLVVRAVPTLSSVSTSITRLPSIR